MTSTIDTLIEIARDLHLESTSSDLAFLKSRLEQNDKEIIIPLVGEFSSGKTSLINSLMDNRVLETASKPVTATIYEIKFGANTPHAEIINQDGTLANEDIDNLSNERLKDAKCVRVFDTSTKVGSQTVLVDTPGLSSNDPQHKITLASFLPHADAIIIITDVNQQVTRSLIDFVENAKLSDRPIYLVLTKCDTKSKEAIENAKKYIKDNLSLPIENMACVSATNGDLSELMDLFSKIQKNKNEIVTKAIMRRLKGIASDISTYIDELLKKSSSNKTMNAKIDELQDELERISRNIEKLIRDAGTQIREKGEDYTNKFQEQTCSRLDAIVQSKSADYDSEVRAAVNSIAQMTMQQYKKEVQYILVNLARERQRTVSEVPLQSLESLDMSGVVLNELSYDLDLATLGHGYDKTISNIAKVVIAAGAVYAAGMAASAAAAKTAGAAGAAGAEAAGAGAEAAGAVVISKAIDVADTVTDVASITSNTKTRKLGEKILKAQRYSDKLNKKMPDIEDMNKLTGEKLGTDKGIIETTVAWFTDKTLGKPQRRRAINNYVSGTLVPEFTMQMEGIASDLKLAIGNLLHEEARNRCAAMEQTLKEMKDEESQSKETHRKRVEQLKEYKKQLNNI